MNFGGVWGTFKELLKVNADMMYLGSLFGAGVSLAVGGFDKALIMLIVLVLLDYFSGMIAGLKTDGLNSSVGFKGIIRKIIIFVVVAFANILDGAMQITILRSMVIFGYAANEGLSIIENIDRMGYGEHIPFFVRNKLERLKEEKLK